MKCERGRETIINRKRERETSIKTMYVYVCQFLTMCGDVCECMAKYVTV